MASAPRAPDAPLSKRPLSLLDIPTLLAAGGVLVGFACGFMDLMLRLNGFETKSPFIGQMYWAAGTGLVWFGILWLIRRFGGGDRCLDIIAWLFPGLTVYEVGGVHFVVMGWVTAVPSPQYRVVLFAQSCHRGSRLLELDLPPKYGCYRPGEGPFRFEVLLGDAGVAMAVASRALPEKETRGLFEIKASVAVRQPGGRVRVRKGFAPETPLMQLGEVVAALHGPVHLAITVASQSGRPEGPIVLERVPELDDVAWPEKAEIPLWSRGGGWQIAGGGNELLARLSDSYAALAPGAKPPDFKPKG